MNNEERERQKDLYNLIHAEILVNLRSVGYTNRETYKGWTTGQLTMILNFGNRKNLWIRIDEGTIKTQMSRSDGLPSARLIFELADPEVFDKVTDFIVNAE